MQIVKCVINDSSDYEYLYESAINNTFEKYFNWSKEHNIPVNFIKTFGDDLIHGLMLDIKADFKHKEDEAQFRFLTSGTTSQDSGYYWAATGLDDAGTTNALQGANTNQKHHQFFVCFALQRHFFVSMALATVTFQEIPRPALLKPSDEN